MQRVSIVAASCGADAVAELLAHVPAQEVPRVGFVVGTTRGCLEADRLFDQSRRDNARFASPAAFAQTLPSTAASKLALTHRLTGPSLVVAAGAVSAAVALRRAVAWMRAFELPFVIAGGLEHDRVGLLLLGEHGAASVTIDSWRVGDLAAPEDASLNALIEWIRHGGSANLGVGVSITR